MLLSLEYRAALGRGIAAGALALGSLAFTFAPPARAAETPTLARTISYEAAEVWSGKGPAPGAEPPGVEPVSSAIYAPTPTPVTETEAALEPMLSADLGVEMSAVEQASAGAPCSSCSSCEGGGGPIYPYNRCGCSSHSLFPWFTGPGACDDWCVGPHWEVAADGLVLFREGVDFAQIPVNPGFTQDLVDDFSYAPGGRVFVTGYNENRFGMQVGYEGVNDFHANALFTNVAGDAQRITYESNLNSVEVNFIGRGNGRWRPLGGFRYIELDDDFVDFTTLNKPVPPPSDPPAAPTAYVDGGRSEFLDNRLIGLQAGAFRDVWRLNRWLTIEPFGNAGVYVNDFKRENVTRTVTTVVRGDDLSTPGNEYSQTTTQVNTTTTQEFSELAFHGEAGITGVLRLNRCVALRGGYQVLAINGVGQGIDAFLAPGLNPTTLLYHGGHFGVEYVR